MRFNRKIIALIMALIMIMNFCIGSIPAFAHEAIALM